jgi:hypothetical protein
VAGVNDNVRISSSYGWLLLLTAALIVLLGIMPGLVVDWLYF